MDVPVSMAMQIAQVSQVRFNEAVARGHYRCAPATKPGSGRTFGFNDLVGLCVFGHLLRLNFSAREAAAYACNTASLIDDNRIHIDKLHLVYTADGKVNQVYRAKGQAALVPDAPVFITIDLDAIRKHVTASMDTAAGLGGNS